MSKVTYFDLLVKHLDKSGSIRLVGCGDLVVVRRPRLVIKDDILQQLGSLQASFLRRRKQLLLDIILDLGVLAKIFKFAVRGDVG